MRRHFHASVMIRICIFIILIVWIHGCSGCMAPISTPSSPKFPWPPPKTSASLIITEKSLGTSRSELSTMPTLGDINLIISTALEASGYVEKSYFAVPDGFALVTRLEQINPDGSPKEPYDRWLTQMPPLRRFTLTDYLRALFTANPGHYRIIVFVLTPHPFSQSNVTVDQEEAMDWLRAGLNKLPQSIAKKPYTNQYTTTALIYEFEQPESREAILKLPSLLTGRTHLQKSGFLQALEK